MAINQLGYFGQLPANRIANFIQNIGQTGIGNPLQTFGQSNIAPTYGGAFELGMAPGQTVLIPEGQWITAAGSYSDVQFYDGASGMWRIYIPADSAPIPLSSDGTNWRFVNSTGCPVGAVVTNAGTAGSLPVSKYTPTGVWTGGVFTAQASPAVTCTASAGASLWDVWIGGAISTTVTITSGGSGYQQAPRLIVVPPVNQGAQPFIPATAVCTISGGVINSVTVTNQGSGYVAAPTILVVNAGGDTTGTGGVLTPALTGAGQVTAVTLNNSQLAYGAAQTAAITLTIGGTSAPASAAASPIMNFTLTNAGAGTVTAGSGYTNGYALYMGGGLSTATPIYTNPLIEKGIITPAQPVISSASTTVVGLNNAASVNTFYGWGIQATTNLVLQPVAGVLTTGGAIVSPTVGGQNDISLLYPL